MKEDTVIIAPASMKKKLIKELRIDEKFCIFSAPGENIELNQIQVELKL